MLRQNKGFYRLERRAVETAHEGHSWNPSQAGNLKYTVDFRSVYATVLDRWMGASSKDILGGSFGSQNFLPQP